MSKYGGGNYPHNHESGSVPAHVCDGCSGGGDNDDGGRGWWSY